MRAATVGSIRSGPASTSVSTSWSRSRDSPSVVPIEIRHRCALRSASSRAASATAIRDAASENWLALPSSSTSKFLIQSVGSKSDISQPLACSNPVVSNAVIGFAALRPERSPARNSTAP